MQCKLEIYLLRRSTGNMTDVLVPGSNPAPQICAAQAKKQAVHKASRHQNSPSGIRTGAKKTRNLHVADIADEHI